MIVACLKEDTGAILTQYRYTATGRIKEIITQSGIRTSYAYDGDVTEGYRYNERNELTEKISGGSLTRYRYDKNGSILSEEQEGRKSEYRYDLLNRQTYARTLDGKEQENCYDGEGLRAGISENGKKTTFLFHNGEILAESGGESAPVRRYLRGNALSHVQTEDGACHAFHQDEQGSTAYITGQGVENCYQYDAFGNLTEKRESFENRILYTGQQYDQETGQYYLRARYYNPVVGRFLQEDTYRGDGLNLYAYCANNPVVYYDPSGHNGIYPNKTADTVDTPGGQVGNDSNYILFNETHNESLPQPKGIGPNGGRLQSHHALQKQWAIENLSQYGYDPDLAPTVTIETGKGMPHTIISSLQNARRDARIANGKGKWSSSLQDELSHIVSDFREAGYSDSTIGNVLEQQYKMLDKLGVSYERIK